MSLTVRTNISAIMGAGNLTRTSADLSLTMGKVSTGLRITKAADDAAGMGVATNLVTQADSTKQAMRNTNDGISLIQTAEGAQTQVIDILMRMRELAVSSASEGLASTERTYIQDEYTSLNLEISRIADVTEFNGIDLTSAPSNRIDVQVGINRNIFNRIAIDLGSLRPPALGLGPSVSLGTASDAQSAIDAIDSARDTVNGYLSSLGAVQNRLDSALNRAGEYVTNVSGAASSIQDADYADETSKMTKFQIMQQAGVAALAQARNMNQSVISLLG